MHYALFTAEYLVLRLVSPSAPLLRNDRQHAFGSFLGQAAALWSTLS